MPSVMKQLVVGELTREFRAMPHAFLVDFTGLGARQADAFRGMLKQKKAAVLVVKNSLAIRALNELKVAGMDQLLQGPTAFVYGGDDPVTLAKSLLDYMRKEQAIKLRGGMMNGRALAMQEVQSLAALPPVQVLRGMVVSAIASPLTGFLGVLQGIIRQFVGVVKAIAEKAPQS